MQDCEDCGENTVCPSCVRFEGKKCQRCCQPFHNEDNVSESHELKNPLTATTNWVYSRDKKWDFKCLVCGQTHLEQTNDCTSFLAPCDLEGNLIECTRLPEISSDFCSCCRKILLGDIEHKEDCRYWKALEELKEACSLKEEKYDAKR